MESQINALSFSLINILIVFAVLLILQGIIQLIKFVAYKKPGDPAEKKTSVNKQDKETEEIADRKQAKEGDIPLKVVAACAAIAASLDGAPHRIVSIRRLTPQSLWIQSARLENITSNAMLRHRR